MAENRFHISSSPHFTFGSSTQKIMLAVLISLLPQVIAGTVVFGPSALLTVLVSVCGAVGFEALFQKITGQKIVIKNLSAAVTGVLLALVLPSTVPLWIVLLGDAVAVIIAKGLFGGIGSNVFNPALTGRAVLVISFPAVLGARWFDPVLAKTNEAVSNFDAVTSATLLSSVKHGNTDAFDFVNYFLGNRAGCIGETSILLILISFLFLLVTKIIDWRAPVAMIITVALGTFFSGLGKGINAASYDVLIALLSGGLLFGATFMVTDYATTPVTRPGRLVFGFGCGLITFLIRKFGGYPEGVMFSILIMNAIAPHLNNLTTRMYGYGKKGNMRADVNKINAEFGLSEGEQK